MKTSYPPMTKPEFLAAFKTCDKYLKSNYIEQETFFHNMVCAMSEAKLNLSDMITPELDSFDEVAYRGDIIRIVKTMGPERWHNYCNLSEQMKAEANSHFFAAGTDSMGIAVGSWVGKGVKFVTKAGVRMVSKGLTRSTIKAASTASRRETAAAVKSVAKKATKSNVAEKATKSKDVLYRFGENDGNRFDVTSEGELKLHIKTHNKNMGRYVGSFEVNTGGKKGYGIDAEISLEKFKNLHYSRDSEWTLIENPLSVLVNRSLEYGADMLREGLTGGSRFSFGDTWLFSNKVVDVGTDFIPVFGNAKAAVSAVTNLAIGFQYLWEAKKNEKLEEKDRDDFKKNILVDISEDLKVMDKTTLYRMWLFAGDQYNRMFIRKLQ